MALYLGIDQALNKIGVCIIENNKSIVSKRIKTPRSLKGTTRLIFLRNELQTLLAPFKNSVTHASMEAQSLGSIGDIDQLGQINGIVQMVLADAGLEHFFKVPPALLKKFVTDNPQASKQQMMRVSKELWGISFANDDECDAHGLARISEEYVERGSTIRHQIEVILSLLHTRKRKRKIKKLISKTI